MIINDYLNMPSFACGRASYADVLRGCIACFIQKNSFPIVCKYQLELMCRLWENQSVLLKSKCWQAKHDVHCPEQEFRI